MCAREVKVMLEIQRFRKYSVGRADNVLVPVPGLEPGRREATDFESVVYTNFTTPALISLPLNTESRKRGRIITALLPRSTLSRSQC